MWRSRGSPPPLERCRTKCPPEPSSDSPAGPRTEARSQGTYYALRSEVVILTSSALGGISEVDAEMAFDVCWDSHLGRVWRKPTC